MRLKKAVCFALAIYMVLCLSACDKKPEIRNYSYEDRVMADVNAKCVHTALVAALADMYKNGKKIDDSIISISNFNPMTLKKTGKDGKGGFDKMYDDEGNIIKINLVSGLGDNFTGYFIADVYIDNDDNEWYVESVEWMDSNTFVWLYQDTEPGLPEGVSEANLLVGYYPHYYDY